MLLEGLFATEAALDEVSPATGGVMRVMVR